MASSTDPLLKAIRYVQSKNDPADSAVAIDSLYRRLQKIAKHPFEDKYRIIEAGDAKFQHKIGKLRGSSDLIECAGFLPVSGTNSWELKASAEAWPKLVQATALFSQAVQEAEQSGQVAPQMSSTTVSTGKSNASKSSSRTASTTSTSGSSSPVEELAARGPASAQPSRPNDNSTPTAPGSSRSSSKGKIRSDNGEKGSKSVDKSNALAKLKAAALKATKQQKQEEQQTEHSKHSEQSMPSKSKSTLQSTSKLSDETTTTSSALDKLKAAAQKAKKKDSPSVSSEKKGAKPSTSQSSSKPEAESGNSSSAGNAIAKLKAAAMKAKEQEAGKRKNQPSPTSPPKTPGSPQKAGVTNALAKFKAAAFAAGNQEKAASTQANARQNPLKLAAQHAVSNGGASDDDTSVRSEQSLTLRDLFMQNSTGNLQKAGVNTNAPGSAVGKFKVAAQQVQAQQPMQNLGNNPNGGGPMANRFQQAAFAAQAQARIQNGGAPLDPRSRFQNAAQAMMMQQKMQQSPQVDPRARFMNATQAMMMQQKMQGSPQKDPRSRFQNAAQMMMMQNRMQQPPLSPNKPMSAAARFKMAAIAAQAQSRVGKNWDGLSYPTSADANDGLSYPSATPEPNARTFMLRTDSGRSLMSASSSRLGGAPNPHNMALVPKGSNHQLMNQASLRQQQSMRGMNVNPSMRNMMSQQNMQGSRPQLMRENSMSLADLQRVPGMASQRQLVAGSVVNGSVNGDKMVSATPKDISREQPKEPREKGLWRTRICANAVNLVTFGELVMDMVTTILSFRQLSSDFDCCGNKVDYGALSLAVTIPYFFLVIVEMTMLTYSICGGGGDDHEKKPEQTGKFGESYGFDDESTVTEKWQCTMGEALSWVICVNPFLGCLITWTLMYEVESKNEALVILGVEGAAIFLMFVTIYLERNVLSTCTMMVHLVPLVPFTVTCFVVWYFLEKGGICFIVEENTFWFDGCELCADGFPPDRANGLCPDGDEPIQEIDFCGAEEQFCYYGY